MKSTPFTVGLGLAIGLSLPAVAAFSPGAADKISFAPSAGTIVTKSFTTVTSMDVEDYEALMDGNPIPGAPSMEMTMESSQSLTVTDEYGEMQDGRLAKLTRSYDAISVATEADIDAGVMQQKVSASGTSDLESKSVVFTWNDESEEYETKFAEGESGDAELLDGLEMELDLRGLLPKEELATGDSYDIDPGALVGFLAPGGDLKLQMETEGAPAGMGGPSPDQMGDLSHFFEQGVEGDVTGKYVGTREIDGVKVAVIELNADIEASADLASTMADLGETGAPPGIEISVDRMDMGLSYEGSGELLWNIAKGHVHSLSIESDISVTMDMGMTMNGEMEMSVGMSMVGSTTTTVTTE